MIIHDFEKVLLKDNTQSPGLSQGEKIIGDFIISNRISDLQTIIISNKTRDLYFVYTYIGESSTYEQKLELLLNNIEKNDLTSNI